MKIFNKDAYVLAFFTGFLYICAYLSALAKANFYDLPLNMISIDIFSLTSAALIIIGLVSCFLVPIIFSIFFSHKLGKKTRIVYLIITILILAYSVYWYATYYLSVTLSLVLTFSFMMSMLAFIYIKREKFIIFINKAPIENDGCNDESAEFQNPSDVNGNIEKSSDKWIFKAASIAVVSFSVCSYVAPYLSCIEKTDYDVFYKDKVKYALIVGSGDTLIAKAVINGKLGEGYYIFKVENLNGVQINNLDIRNLNP